MMCLCQVQPPKCFLRTSASCSDNWLVEELEDWSGLSTSDLSTSEKSSRLGCFGEGGFRDGDRCLGLCSGEFSSSKTKISRRRRFDERGFRDGDRRLRLRSGEFGFSDCSGECVTLTVRSRRDSLIFLAGRQSWSLLDVLDESAS